MIKMNHVLTALLLTVISVAHAETATAPAAAPAVANQPVAQGAGSVNNNLGNNPDNKGLKNAAEHLKANEDKVAEHRADADKKHEDKNKDHAKHEQHETHEHMDKPAHDKMERPAKPERPAK
jgi:hypothetical protein